MIMDDLLKYASISMASYSNLLKEDSTLIRDNNIEKLKVDGFTDSQYSLQSGYIGDIKATHTDEQSGFTAHAFVDSSNNITIGFRGTDEFIDNGQNSVLTLEGAAFRHIIQAVNWWNEVSNADGDLVDSFNITEQGVESAPPQNSLKIATDNILGMSYYVVKSEATANGDLVAEISASGGNVSVTGHSLGGHIAMAFAGVFSGEVEEVVTFNSPGFKDNSITQAFFNFLGGSLPQPGDPKITNVIADADLGLGKSFSPIAGLNSIPGSEVNISIEDQLILGEPKFPVAFNHSQMILTDALAIMSAINPFASNLTTTIFETLLSSVSGATYDSLEKVISSFRAAIVGNDESISPGNDQRELLYSAIKDLSESVHLGNGEFTLVPVHLSSGGALQDTPEGYAYRYALENLNPFVILHTPEPGQQSIYDQHNLNGSLNAKNYSVEYLSARLSLLNDKNTAYSNNQDELTTTEANFDRKYKDIDSDFTSLYESTDDNDPDLSIFASKDGSWIVGGEKNDFLFGRGGNDLLQGGSGEDFLEGGKGMDVLKGGSGIDTYHFNTGDSNIQSGLFDRIIDSDASNKLSFGSTVNTNSFKYYNIGNADLGVYFESAEGAKDLIILDNWYSNQNMIIGLDLGENLSKVLTPQIDHLDYGWGQWSGTAGVDHISYIPTLFDDSDNPTTNYVIAGFAGDDVLAGFNVSGGSGNDTITFYNPNNPQNLGGKLYGGTGNDTIYGGDHNDMIVTFADGPHASIWTILEMIALDVNFDIDDLNLEGMPEFDPTSYLPDYSDPDSADMRAWYERILDLEPGKGETNNVSSGDGFDTVYGGFGNEIYHLYAGEGAESIIDMGGENTVTFDYNLADVSVMLQGGSFFFYQGDTFPSTFGSFLNPYSDAGYMNNLSVTALGGNETFTYQFTDETVEYSEILAMAYDFKASDGDDVINFEGGYSNEIAKTIDLGAGNDTLVFDGSHANLIGGTGDDAYDLWSNADAENTVTLRSGDGNDILQHYFGSLDLDIQFEANPQGVEVNAEDITIEQNTLTSGNKEWVVRYSDNDSLTIRGASGLWGVSFILPAGLLLTLSDFSETVYAAESGGYVNTGSTVGSTIVSGIGQDTISDNMANNTQYELALGSGQDTLYDMGGQDAIIFGQNIEQSDLVFVREGANLTIEYSENDRVTLQDWYTFGDYRVESIQFTDGTALNSGELSLLTDSLSVGDLELVGSQYEDYLMGDTGNDTLTGGEGNDYLSGGEGNDEYRFNLGDGMDTVSDYSGADTFVFGPGILPSDIVFQRIGDNLQVNYSLNDSITIEYWFFGAEYRVESFEFDDGTVWDQAYLSGQTDTLITPGMTVDGTEYDDYLYGSSGDDVLTGGTGNDTLFGGQGNDEYRFGLGDGLDIVSEEGGVDTLVFGPGISASDIVLTRMGDNLEIAYSPNDAILIDYWYASPDLKIEAFMFDDGTVWDQTTITNLTANLAEPDLTVTGSEFDDHLTTGGGNDDVSGLGGHDIIETYAGNDTLNGGTGDDYLIGGQGDDSYFFTIGDGVDFIHDEGGADQIVFGPSITQSDVSFERFGDNLTVHYNASDSFTVSGWYATPEFEIEAFHFNDGSSWNASALEGLTENLPVQALPGVELTGTEFGDFLTGSEGNDILVGLAGDDFLESYSGDDVLTGGTGMDYLIGGAGNDTYLFNVGDGVDFIGDEDGQDAIHFGESISLADLLIETDGNDLFIHYTENDSITVDSHAGIGKVETIHFYDGSFIDSAAIDAMTIQQQVPDAA